MRIVLIGAPGSGKMTQANNLRTRLGVTPVFVGALLKKIAQQESERASIVRELLSVGQSVPEEIAHMVLKEQLADPQLRGSFLLVDYPRTLEQAQSLDRLMRRLGLDIGLVLQLVGDEDHFMERLEGREACSDCAATYNEFSNPPVVDGVCDLCGGRIRRYAGQNREVISTRVRAYLQQSALLEHYYSQDGRLHQVNGDRDIEVVSRDLCARVAAQLGTQMGVEPAAKGSQGAAIPGRRRRIMGAGASGGSAANGQESAETGSAETGKTVPSVGPKRQPASSNRPLTASPGGRTVRTEKRTVTARNQDAAVQSKPVKARVKKAAVPRKKASIAVRAATPRKKAAAVTKKQVKARVSNGAGHPRQSAVSTGKPKVVLDRKSEAGMPLPGSKKKTPAQKRRAAGSNKDVADKTGPRKGKRT